MSTQVIVGRISGLAGRVDELSRLLVERAEVVRAEPGCIAYEVAAVVEEPADFLMIQTWASAEAMRAHFGTDSHADYQLAIGELLARPSTVVMHEVATTTRPLASTSPTDPGRFG
jgi:quinol monooxygenase YgiN